MIYYAARNKVTKKYLPERRKGDSGYTKSEPALLKERPPRLHVKERAAQAALRCWLAGRWREVQGRNSSWFGDDDWIDMEIEKVPERKPEEWEIVPMRVAIHVD